MPFPTEVVAHLSQFRAPTEQSIEVGEFYECYDILLRNSPFANAWQTAKSQVELHNRGQELSANSRITRQCLAMEQCQDKDWLAAYLLTMLWGFGDSKDGPAKLFVSTKTPQAEGKIPDVAKLVTEGKMESAYDQFCLSKGNLHLRQIGTSFGTKFLFAVGIHLPPPAVRPLVCDKRIKDALSALRSRFSDSLSEEAYPWFKVVNGKEYLDYCSCINETADKMNQELRQNTWDAYSLEQLLFERAAKITSP